jgi:hypothetical protein
MTSLQPSAVKSRHQLMDSKYLPSVVYKDCEWASASTMLFALPDGVWIPLATHAPYSRGAVLMGFQAATSSGVVGSTNTTLTGSDTASGSRRLLLFRTIARTCNV